MRCEFCNKESTGCSHWGPPHCDEHVEDALRIEQEYLNMLSEVNEEQ